MGGRYGADVGTGASPASLAGVRPVSSAEDRPIMYRFKLKMSQGMSRLASHRSSRTFWSRCAHRIVFVAVSSIFSTCALFVPSALAVGPPVIESSTATVSGEVAIGADIDPEGLETTYEIWLECPCDPGGGQVTGSLPAVDEVRTVTLVLSGLQPGRYGFAVRAINAAGEASQRSNILEVPSSPGSFPEGTAPVGVIEAPYLGSSTGQLLAIAEREARERGEREAKEREAKEAEERIPLSMVEAERQHKEEAEAAADQQRTHVCVVPSLRGDTFSAASRALAKAHCRLGKVNRPSHRHGTLLVIRESPHPGVRLPASSRVTLTLGAKVR